MISGPFPASQLPLSRGPGSPHPGVAMGGFLPLHLLPSASSSCGSGTSPLERRLWGGGMRGALLTLRPLHTGTPQTPLTSQLRLAPLPRLCRGRPCQALSELCPHQGPFLVAVLTMCPNAPPQAGRSVSAGTALSPGSCCAPGTGQALPKCVKYCTFGTPSSTQAPHCTHFEGLFPAGRTLI